VTDSKQPKGLVERGHNGSYCGRHSLVLSAPLWLIHGWR
jgi:hypothetical protein